MLSLLLSVILRENPTLPHGAFSTQLTSWAQPAEGHGAFRVRASGEGPGQASTRRGRVRSPLPKVSNVRSFREREEPARRFLTNRPRDPGNHTTAARGKEIRPLPLGKAKGTSEAADWETRSPAQDRGPRTGDRRPRQPRWDGEVKPEPEPERGGTAGRPRPCGLTGSPSAASRKAGGGRTAARWAPPAV